MAALITFNGSMELNQLILKGYILNEKVFNHLQVEVDAETTLYGSLVLQSKVFLSSVL